MPSENPVYLYLRNNQLYVIRFIMPLFNFKMHWLHKTDETGTCSEQIKNCPGKPECPLCEQTNKSFERYAAYCIDRSDDQFKIIEIGPMLFKHLSKNYDELNKENYNLSLGNHQRDIDWNIIRHHTENDDGPNGTRYEIFFSHYRSPLTYDQITMARNYEQSFQELYPKLTRQNILDIMDGKEITSRKSDVILPKRTRWQSLEIN